MFTDVTRDTLPYNDLLDPSQLIISLPEMHKQLEDYGWALQSGSNTTGLEVGCAGATDALLC